MNNLCHIAVCFSVRGFSNKRYFVPNIMKMKLCYKV